VVLYLTEREKQDLSDVASGITLAHLTNGVPVPEQRAEPPTTPEMLLIARLHPRKRVTTFIRAAIELLNQGLVATFAVVGPDEGDGPEVRTLIEEAGHGELIRWEGPMAPEAVLARLLRSSVFVLPAVDEPFPMAVLEAMAVALPVIVTDSCGLAPMVDRTGSGMVVTDSRSALVDAMRQMIFDPDGRRSMGGRARDAAAAELGMPAVARRLETIYAAAATHE
jgi:glycosyltransferase involved in cell wall biosynthesis